MKNSWQADSREQLAEVVRSINVTVPLRSEGRLTDHCERHCIARLLATLPSHRLQFPLQLEHFDRPDFVLSMAGAKTGIEHTEAVSQNAAEANSLRERGLIPETYFATRATPGERKKSKAEIIQETTAHPLGSVWYGDSVEQEWANAMLFFVRKKIEKTQKARIHSTSTQLATCIR